VPRVGILGGAFNPPHIGHLICAQEATVQLALDSVEFVPTPRPPHREIEQDPGAEVRLEMCELAVADDDRFSTSRIELDREGPSYTSDTLRQLHEARPEDELFLLLGGDQAERLPTWHEPDAVLALATVCAVERVGYSRNAIVIKLARLKGAEKLRFLEMPVIQVSSSSVRRRVSRGQPIRYLVPDPVASFIGEKGLYGAPAAVGSG
jgi:nicotinate-nucleotide adenylyltransferase